jgi:RNA-directed DNA polymerase
VEEPTLREIFAATFRDRVVHHLLYNFLEPIFEPKFIDQSYACRENKGTHQSLKDLQKYLGKITHNYRQKVYFMHLDIKGFFMALKKDILFELISKQVKNPEFLWLAKIIVFNDPLKNFTVKGNLSLFDKIPVHRSLFHVPRNQGLPIGNLTSQFFANIYLNELDQFAKHQLKIKYYMRYVDDFLILHTDKNQLKQWRNQIIHFLKQRLELNLNLQKQIIQTNDRGINWLGYIVKPTHILIRQRTVKALKRKLYLFNQKILNLNLEHPIRLWTPELCKDFKEIFAVINSYYGFFKYANTFQLRRHIYKKHFGILKIYLAPADKKYNYFIWLND